MHFIPRKSIETIDAKKYWIDFKDIYQDNWREKKQDSLLNIMQ